METSVKPLLRISPFSLPFYLSIWDISSVNIMRVEQKARRSLDLSGLHGTELLYLLQTAYLSMLTGEGKIGCLV